ncbi:YrdB family protein [Nocardia nova]|uniref:YrdB family protein n=1 Tax=Nocardia nova TaxID=37330 RepID=UPI003C7BCA14
MELAALAALGVWGWKVADATAIKVVSAIGAPLIAAVFWGLFAAPKPPSTFRCSRPPPRRWCSPVPPRRCGISATAPPRWFSSWYSSRI